MSTAALAANSLTRALAPQRSPEGAPTAPATPRRRPRIQGTTTESLPVRGCSGESVARREATATRLQPQIEPSALRLTRRGRMLLTALSVLIFGSAIVVLGLRVTGVLEPGPHFTHTVPVQVAPGQTLWSIAQNTNPTEDPAAVVEKIADLNKLSSPADITPGETLQIPIAG